MSVKIQVSLTTSQVSHDDTRLGTSTRFIYNIACNNNVHLTLQSAQLMMILMNRFLALIMMIWKMMMTMMLKTIN